MFQSMPKRDAVYILFKGTLEGEDCWWKLMKYFYGGGRSNIVEKGSIIGFKSYSYCQTSKLFITATTIV